MRATLRIFLDANVLFSATAHDAAVRELCRRLRHAGHDLVADAFVLEEARRNLAAKTTLGLTAWEPTRALLAATPEMATPRDLPPEAAGLPDKDRPVLTGDRTHFGFLFGKKVGGVRVVSLRQLAEALLT